MARDDSHRRRLRRLLRDPLGVLTARARWLGQLLRYAQAGGYRRRAYWTDRLGRFGTGDLRGVGCDSLSDRQNREIYEQARRQFLELCADEEINLATARVLDVGCGTGFYASILAQAGNRTYTGVDIADVLFPALRQRLPGYVFTRLDVTEQELPGVFDLILMIDVTQHITQPQGFTYAMRNVRRHLSPAGVFIVTSWLDGSARRSFFEVSRDLHAYRLEFPYARFSSPRPFRDKFIFALRPGAVEVPGRKLVR